MSAHAVGGFVTQVSKGRRHGHSHLRKPKIDGMDRARCMSPSAFRRFLRSAASWQAITVKGITRYDAKVGHTGGKFILSKK
jgi:hypothetical protein